MLIAERNTDGETSVFDNNGAGSIVGPLQAEVLSQGLRVLAMQSYRHLTWQVYAGAMNTWVSGREVLAATVKMGGAGLAFPLGRRLDMGLNVAGYRDNFSGSHTS